MAGSLLPPLQPIVVNDTRRKRHSHSDASSLCPLPQSVGGKIILCVGKGLVVIHINHSNKQHQSKDQRRWIL
ncbi:hypothetical protein MUK42_28059 [Musa troglodytarum]|uniref:Uncharacterized protein n=1 Tax=Musa troglodytarum TaxID=320322 RepID=A0A9E7JQZ0_9LILI|nr:hypothetical protein MUK42_28059 [Musa troglodytarum]